MTPLCERCKLPGICQLGTKINVIDEIANKNASEEELSDIKAMLVDCPNADKHSPAVDSITANNPS